MHGREWRSPLAASVSWPRFYCRGLASRDVNAHPRNVLVITLDTMRADRLPVYGFSGIETPTLARLAAGGAVFQQAFAAAPLTLPSHAALFTGLLPPQTGIRDNASPPLGDDFTTLAEILRDSGRKTAAFIGSSVLTPSRGLGQGFDSFSEPATGCGGPPRTAGLGGGRRCAGLACIGRSVTLLRLGPICSTPISRTTFRMTSRTGTSISISPPSPTKMPRSAGSSHTSKPAAS